MEKVIVLPEVWISVRDVIWLSTIRPSWYWFIMFILTRNRQNVLVSSFQSRFWWRQLWCTFNSVTEKSSVWRQWFIPSVWQFSSCLILQFRLNNSSCQRTSRVQHRRLPSYPLIKCLEPAVDDSVFMVAVGGRPGFFFPYPSISWFSRCWMLLPSSTRLLESIVELALKLWRSLRHYQWCGRWKYDTHCL